MPWIKKSLKRAYACNAALVLHLRERRGWTQFQLAMAAGLSERLVSKVESGKPISTRAIDLLATALSLPEEPAYPEDLISDPLKLAQDFVHAMNTLNKGAFNAIRHLLDEDIDFHISGDPAVFPFAGERHGVEEVALAFKSLYSILEAPHDLEPHCKDSFTYVVEGNEVIVWGDCWLHPIGRPMEKPMKITQRMKFRRGKMYDFDDIFDTLKGARLLEEAKVEEAKASQNQDQPTGAHFHLTKKTASEAH